MGELIVRVRRDIDYHYKACDIEKLNSLEKKRYELMNDYGYNFDVSSKRKINEEMQVMRHKNSESK